MDADGKAIEHWDTLQLVGDPKNSAPLIAPNIPRANPNGMFLIADGRTSTRSVRVHRPEPMSVAAGESRRAGHSAALARRRSCEGGTGLIAGGRARSLEAAARVGRRRVIIVVDRRTSSPVRRSARHRALVQSRRRGLECCLRGGRIRTGTFAFGE